MVDCSCCKHLYLKQIDKYTVCSECDLGLLLEENGYIKLPISCSGFEWKEKKKEKQMQVEIKSKKIESIKVQNGKMECIGDVFQITGDFVIEFNVEEE